MSNRDYSVIVTFGNTQKRRYATNCNAANAEKLRESAVEKGFDDAAVWLEKDFAASCRYRQRSEAAPTVVA